jgi:hypothetical protein
VPIIAPVTLYQSLCNQSLGQRAHGPHWGLKRLYARIPSETAKKMTQMMMLATRVLSFLIATAIAPQITATANEMMQNQYAISVGPNGMQSLQSFGVARLQPLKRTRATNNRMSI